MKKFDMKSLCNDESDGESDTENDILDIVTIAKPTLSTLNYRRLADVKNISGFVVNIHDAINFDIDLELPYPIRASYRTVIINNYIYHDYSCQDLIDVVKTINDKVGLTYRCRLRGIGINKANVANRRWKMTQIAIAVKQLINRSDGWVVCTLADIDIYQRLLVDIYIHTITGTINLYDFILKKMIEEDEPIYYKYKYKK